MSIRLAVLTLLFHFILPVPSNAQWATDGVAVSTAAFSQHSPAIIPDGAGGVIMAWVDGRTGTDDGIYAQRISSAGIAQWTGDGVILCATTSVGDRPAVVSDGAGGAIIAWDDNRTAPFSHLYAQRINAAGVVQWTTNGVPVSVGTTNKGYPVIVADGAGGAIIAWHNYGFTTKDIYARRIDAAGVVQWTANGVALCTAANDQTYPVIVADGAGGATVAWMDERDLLTPTYIDIYAQRVNSSGSVQWAVNGVALCTAVEQQAYPSMVSDGAGGAVCAWTDTRSGLSNDVYAQRINPSGVVQWSSNGVSLGAVKASQYWPAMASDGASGAIVVWQAYPVSFANADLFAQRVNASGAALWTASGVALGDGPGNQMDPAVAADGAGGAVVTWDDDRSGTLDIRAQRVSASGAKQLPDVQGAILCAAVGDQLEPRVALVDGTGGAIIAWDDSRGGSDADIYAQQVPLVPTGVGGTPLLPSLTSLPNWPNPFSGSTEFEVLLPSESAVTLDVYDVAGRRVRQIALAQESAGWRRIAFDGRDDAGRPLASGVYFGRVTSSSGEATRKIMIAR